MGAEKLVPRGLTKSYASFNGWIDKKIAAGLDVLSLTTKTYEGIYISWLVATEEMVEFLHTETRRMTIRRVQIETNIMIDFSSPSSGAFRA